MPDTDTSAPVEGELESSVDADQPTAGVDDADVTETPGDSGGGDGGQPPSVTGGGADDHGGGHIVDHNIERELQDSYLTYAMSTIMDRALPDVRDGLKPSQRRILVAMDELRLRPNTKHMKCAKIAGDTSGNYHPHGESVIYPTLVGMAQPWRMRTPLIDSQGNFGSIDGDPPAAMRYTEARLTAAAMEMLDERRLGTVDEQPNYDERLMEPTVLPGRFPNLLVNGGIGIAVGMATSLSPHNPTEVLDSIIRTIENPEIALTELLQDVLDEDGAVVRRGIRGPDFPTGGRILGRRGILDAYTTGRGKVTVRGVVRAETTKSGRDTIIVDTIPYGLNQTTLMERIVEAVKDERIKDVSDVRNESGREARTRIVIDLKRNADPGVIENQLYQFTPLQQTFSIHNIALVNRQPRTLSLQEMIRYYIDHRVDVIRRRTAHLLRAAKQDAHKLEGKIYAVCDIDEVIKLIRSSQTRQEAITRLMERRFRIPLDHKYAPLLPERLRGYLDAMEDQGGVLLTRVQAETIGALRLIQLVGLEIESLTNDYAELIAKIEDYESILNDMTRVLAIVKDDCERMRAAYGKPRLTAIEEAEGDIDLAELIQVEDVAVTISRQGYAKRVSLSTYRQQGRGGKGIMASASKDDDFIEHFFVASTHDDLLCFTDTGRVFKIKVFELPEMSRQSRGRPMVNIISLKPGERTCAYLAISDFESGSHYLTFASRRGIVKRTPLKDYRNVNKSGLIAVGLKEGDALLDVVVTGGENDLLLAASNGLAIRFNEQDVRLMGRTAAGVKGIDLASEASVVGLVHVPMIRDDDGDPVTTDPTMRLLTITENGYGKRTSIDEYRVQPESGKARSQSRGGKGRADIKTTDRNGPSISAIGVMPGDDIVVVSRGGQLVRMAADSISAVGRGTQGVRVVSLKGGDAVIAVARVAESHEEPGGDAAEAPDDAGGQNEATDAG